MYRYFFFDLDGTLTDPGIGITNAVMFALRKFDITPPPRKELYCFIGPPLHDSFQNYYGMTAQQAETAVAAFREYYRPIGIQENELYPAIPELLEELRSRGIKLVLATSKPEEFAVQILKHFDLFPYFDFIGGATFDTSRTRKADVIAYVLHELQITDRNEVLMIGDREQDIAGAKANGLASAGVLWGYGSFEEFSAAGADYIISEPMELVKLCGNS